MVSTHLKNISQNGNLPQIGVKMKNLSNHHPASVLDFPGFRPARKHSPLDEHGSLISPAPTGWSCLVSLQRPVRKPKPRKILLMAEIRLTSWGKGSLSHYLRGLAPSQMVNAGFLPSTVSSSWWLKPNVIISLEKYARPSKWKSSSPGIRVNIQNDWNHMKPPLSHHVGGGVYQHN